MRQKEISKREIVRQLYKTKRIQAFLRKHKCLSTFIKHLNPEKEELRTLLYDGIKKDDLYYTLFLAFDWNKTEEGFEYWLDLYNKIN